MLELTLDRLLVFLLLRLDILDLFPSNTKLIHKDLDLGDIVVFGCHLFQSFALLVLDTLEGLDFSNEFGVALLCFFKGVFVLHQLFKSDFGVHP